MKSQARFVLWNGLFCSAVEVMDGFSSNILFNFRAPIVRIQCSYSMPGISAHGIFVQ
jgi:hypothetical protein